MTEGKVLQVAQVIFGPEELGAEAPRHPSPSISVGVTALFLLVTSVVFGGTPGPLRIAMWTGLGVCMLTLAAMGAHRLAMHGRAVRRYRRAVETAGASDDGWRPMVWPHPTAFSPHFERKAS